MSNIIFDFDGTLADTLPLVTELFNEWSGREPLTKAQLEVLRAMPAREVIKHLGIRWWRVPRLLSKGRKELSLRLHEVKMHPGLSAVLAKLQANGHKLYVLSSNSPENIKAFLKANQVEDSFLAVYGDVGIFRKTKALKTVTKEQNIDINATYYVCDEARDIDAAKKAGIKSVAVSWGYNSSPLLTLHKPDFLITDPAALIGIADTIVEHELSEGKKPTI